MGDPRAVLAELDRLQIHLETLKREIADLTQAAPPEFTELAQMLEAAARLCRFVVAAWKRLAVAVPATDGPSPILRREAGVIREDLYGQDGRVVGFSLRPSYAPDDDR